MSRNTVTEYLLTLKPSLKVNFEGNQRQCGPKSSNIGRVCLDTSDGETSKLTWTLM